MYVYIYITTDSTVSAFSDGESRLKFPHEC